MNDLDALVASMAVTDPSEVHKNNVEADKKKAELEAQTNQEKNKNKNKSKTVTDEQ